MSRSARLRALALLATGAAVMALVLTLVSNPHALPVPSKKPWSQWSLKQKERYVRANLRHARGQLAYVKRRAVLYAPGVARRLRAEHLRLARKATRNLAAILERKAAREHMDWCREGECVRTLIRRIFVEDPEGAIVVAGCESGFYARPVEGLSITGQYTGVFQLGTSERATWGRGIYRSPDPYTAIQATAWEQIQAGHRLYQDMGWGPWQCSPSGGLNW